MNSLSCDILVLGGGPGGYTAAFRAADLGKSVIIVDSRDTLGGVCLNIGCIPSKALLHLAENISHKDELENFGLNFGTLSFDFAKVHAHRDNVIASLTKGLSFLAKKRKVEVVVGTGSFISNTELLVTKDATERKIVFETAIIAAGSRPIEIPSFPHSDPRVWDSSDALKLDTIPEKLFVLGGGIIGLEMASVYNAFGSKVTVVEMLPQIIPPADKDVSRVITKSLKEQGISIKVNTKAESIEAEDKGIKVVYGDTEDYFDAALISIGRRPNSDKIGIEALGLETNEKGFITVDKTQKTSLENIFAIGDIVPGPMLAHKAAHEGKVAAESACGLKSAFIAQAIPSVAYTFPEVAWTGLSEKEATEQGIEYKVGKVPWRASGRSLSQGNTEGFTKVLFDVKTERVIGAALVGPHAGELIGEATLALEMGADMEDLGRTIHPHPTLTETIGLAAEVAKGTAVEL